MITLSSRITTDNELMDAIEFLQTKCFTEAELKEKMDLIIELKGMMGNQVIHFVYRKTDGSERHAYGTRDMEILSRHNALAGAKGRKSLGHVSTGTFPYFDLQRQAWRCFRIDSLLSIDKNYLI